MTAITTICLGTRGSALARWQTEHVMRLLQKAWPALHMRLQVITTRGDQMLDTPLPLVGEKGLFTAELEAALHRHEVDLAVHSLKDLPTQEPDRLVIGAIIERGNPADALVSRDGHTLETLPTGATIGTSSRRRAAQLLHLRPDLHIADIRGNVDTRVRKALDPDGPYDAVVLAYAGLERLGQTDVVSQVLTLEQMLPAPGQGALAVQCRDEALVLSLLAPIHHMEMALAVTAERAFLAGLGGGCALPVAAYASVEGNGEFRLRGRVTAPDGSRQIDVSTTIVGYTPTAAQQAGAELAQAALAQGAAALLDAAP